MRTTMPRAGQWRGVATSLLAIVAAIGSAPTAAAQNIISVPFTQGFIGTRGSSAGTANNVLTYQTLGISRTFFIQNSSTNSFELQGNDIPGTLRIVRTDGVTLDIPASANWRNSGGTTYLMGILPRPTSPITYTYPGGSISITDGSVNGGSSIGGYLAGYNGSTLTDGASTSGNAAQSQLLSALNAYLTTVVSFRPAGPVTVTALTTSSTTPTIAGTATVASGEALTVVVAGVQYSTLSSLAVIRNGNSWSLTLTTPLSLGTYDVAATITNANGFTLSDVTLNELVISAQVTTLTVGGSFTANDKVYDGSITATGTTAGLTLLGVNGGDSVTIASATLAFATAAAGTGRTVSITAITLGGSHANSYTVSLTGAPTTTAAITQRAATVTGISVAAKVYDGSLTASVTGTAAYGNLAPAETFPVSGTPMATFATKVIGSATPVTITGYAAPSANYTVTQPTGLGASITARPLTLGGSFTATSRPFDGTTAAVIATNALTLTPVVTGDTVSLTTVTATFVDAAVGTAKPVSITAATIGGASAGNYTVSVTGAPTTTADITTSSAALTIGGTLSANDKVYDGSITAIGTTTGLTLLGVNGGDSVTIASATLAFATAAAGTGRTVSITAITLGGSHANSYTVSLTGAPTTTAAITQRAATVTGISVAAKVYDGSLTASVTGTAAYGNLAPAETFPVSGTPMATFATKVIGSATPVTITGYAAPSANYTVTQPTGLGASITARPLTLGGSFTATSRPFDGTTAAVIATNALTLTPVVTGDTVSLTTVTATFVDAAVGTAKPVSITAATIGGASAGNYTVSVTGAPTTTASIVAAALPSPPSAPRALVASPGDGSVAITWNAPIDAGCGVIRSYAVETSRDGGSTWTRQVVSAPAGSVTMSALSNNTTYQLRTLATNDCGTSAPSSIVTFVPISVTREGGGAPRTNPAGTATTTINGTATPVVTNVIGDSAVVIGQGTSFTLSVHVVDSARVPIPVDSTRVLSFEQGGNAVVAGRGFKPGTVATLYLYSNTNPNQPALLAQVTVRADGTFDASSAVSATARPPGSYTVQINGIDEVDALRSVAIGVEVTEPPPELTMTSTADKLAPAPNDTVLITLRITNRGSGPAIDVVIPRAFTEPGFRMLTAVPLHGTYDQPSQTWRIPRIDVGASAVMQITAVLIIAAAAPTPLIVP